MFQGDGGLLEIVLIAILTGGGAAAIRQLVDAYLVWKESRGKARQFSSESRQEAAVGVIEMLRQQLILQREDYEERLSKKDEYYQKELQTRSDLYSSSFELLNDLFEESNKMRLELERLVSEYEKKEREEDGI